MSATNNILTASRMGCYQRCPRAHYWQCEVGLLKDKTGLALYVGSAWHRGMEERWNGADYDTALERALHGTGEEIDAYTSATIAGLLSAYYQLYKDDNLNVKMRQELEFNFPLAGSKHFRSSGKIDRLGTKSCGTDTLVEYKSTGESLKPDSGYWLRLRFNPQLMQYFLAARALGYNVKEVIYDVVRKPSIGPKTIQDLDEYGKKIVLDPQGKRVFQVKGKNKGEPRQSADKERGYVIQEHQETPDEFFERLVLDCLSRPDFYFSRREVPIFDTDLNQFKAQRLVIARSITFHRELAAQLRIKPEDAWPRSVSENNCKFCSYQSFCLQGVSVNLKNPPQGFSVKPFNPELSTYDTTQEDIDSSSAAAI